MLIEVAAVDISYPGSVPLHYFQADYDYDTLFSPVWNKRESEAISPPPDMTISEWADENRVLQAGISRNPGPWKTDYTPYLRPIMDAYNIMTLRHLVFCAGTQLGKTETLYNILGFIIDHEPWSTLHMSPREDDAKMVSRTRIKPMINDCESLRDKKPASRSEFKTLEMSFPGMFLYLVGANSLAGLSSKPCRNILRDEKNKFPERLGADADPDSKSEERAKSFWDIRKIVDVSSPGFAKKGILRDLETCDVIYVIHHPCPHCGEYIRLYPTCIQYDDEPDSKHRAMIAKKSAHYVCQKCGGRIDNGHRAKMIADFHFQQQFNIKFGLDNDGKNRIMASFDELGFEPEKYGYWVSSLSSPMLSWGDIAQIWVRAIMHRDETGETTKLQNVINDWFAEPWKQLVKALPEDLILAKKNELPALVVPSWAYALTCGIDVQKYGFWFTVWAWSKTMQSALIHYGYLVSWDDVEQLVFSTTFPVEDSDKKMMIWRAAMDIGGGKDSTWGEDFTKTEEIITWIRANGRGVVHAIKGMSRNTTGQKVRHSILDKMPGQKGGKIPGGLSLWSVDANQMKDNVTWRFEGKEVDSQPLSLHCDVGKDFAQQMTAEEKQRDRNGRWVWVRVKKDNHLLDATVYAHAAADFQWLGGVSILSEPQYIEMVADGAGVHKMESEEVADVRNIVRGYKRPNWLGQRR